MDDLELEFKTSENNLIHHLKIERKATSLKFSFADAKVSWLKFRRLIGESRAKVTRGFRKTSEIWNEQLSLSSEVAVLFWLVIIALIPVAVFVSFHRELPKTYALLCVGLLVTAPVLDSLQVTYRVARSAKIRMFGKIILAGCALLAHWISSIYSRDAIQNLTGMNPAFFPKFSTFISGLICVLLYIGIAFVLLTAWALLELVVSLLRNRRETESFTNRSRIFRPFIMLFFVTIGCKFIENNTLNIEVFLKNWLARLDYSVGSRCENSKGARVAYLDGGKISVATLTANGWTFSDPQECKISNQTQ